METLEALREMLERAGLTPYAAAIRAGKSHSYVSNLFGRRTIPSAARLATIADACGYDLTLQPREGGDPIIITPTPRPPGE